MAQAAQYAEWLQANQDKKGSDLYNRALEGYKIARTEELKASKPKEKESPYSVDNLVGAAVEPIVTLGTGAGASVLAGLAGLGALAANAIGLDAGDPIENIHGIQKSLTYEPGSEGGKTALGAISYPFEKLAEGGQAVGNRIIEDSTGKPGGKTTGPLMATAADTFINAIPMAFGMRGAGKMSPKSNFEIINKSADLTEKPYHTVKDAILNRLPGNAERASSQALNEMIGPDRLPIVKQMLERAKDGETAGQAAAGSGSHEFSALQKMAETIDPSGYGAIKNAQIAKMDNLLKEKFNADPKKLEIARELLKRESEIRYGKSKNDLIDPRSQAEIINSVADKANALAEQAKKSKESAMQDYGQLKTLEEQQKNMYVEPSGKIKSVLQAREQMQNVPMLKRQNGPLRNYMDDFNIKDGELPYIFKNQADDIPRNLKTSEQARIAAKEVEALAKDRALSEKTHRDIESFLRSEGDLASNVGMKDFISRPSIRAGIREARRSAMEKPVPGYEFPTSLDQPMSVETLQRIKQGISDAIRKEKNSQSGLAPKKEAEMVATIESFNKWIRSKSPKFAKADDAYKQDIKLINQMEAGVNLREALKPTFGEKTASNKFVTEFEKMKDKGKLKDVTPEQLESYETVKAFLNKDIILNEQASSGMAAMDKVLGTSFEIPQAHILYRAFVIMNAIIKRVEGKNTDTALKIIAEKLKSPKDTLELIAKASPEEQAAFNKAMLEARNKILAAGSIKTAEEQ